MPTPAPAALRMPVPGRDPVVLGLIKRIRAHFWLKAVGTSAFMWLFFEAYFRVLRNPQGPVTVMPLTELDRWVAFEPWALWPYFSLWVYVTLPPALIPSLRELVRYGLWVGALCIAGLAFFYFWPSAVPAQPLPPGEHLGFGLLRGIDAAGNACPSLHVASAIFSAIWLGRLLRDASLPGALQWLNALWLLAIVWSTLATKQHVWWDVVAGITLAAVFAPLSLRGQGEPRRAAAIIGKRWGSRADQEP